MAFATLVIAQLIHVYDCRNEHSIFDRHPFKNKYLNIAVLSSTILLLCVIYIEPLQPIFHTTHLKMIDWLFFVSLSLFPDRKSTRLNSSHVSFSYAVFCLY